MDLFGSQLYIEGEKDELFIYFHLRDFKLVRVFEVLDRYIDVFRNRDLDKISISFFNRGVPGEHLSSYRKTNDKAIGKLLKGIKCIDACFHFKDNIRVINKPKLIN